MATHRGFVQSIEINLAAVAKVTVLHADASTGTYIIQDLDGDPERFNERLSKLAILRDAMNRAEPVEIEHSKIEQGEEITRAVRITRDALGPPGVLDQISGMVIELAVTSQNVAAAGAEMADRADVTLLADDLTTAPAYLDLQAPERLVASDQLDMLREAQEAGQTVRLVVTATARGEKRIVGVAVGDLGGGTFGRTAVTLNGFVETLGLIKDFAGEPGTFAHVRFTTAPPFTGPGNVVSTTPFTPELVDLLVPRNSLSYELFEAGLCETLRMRVSAVRRQPAEKTPTPDRAGAANAPGAANALAGVMIAPAAANPAPQALLVVFAAELVAPLASASRPVWVMVARESLDRDPEQDVYAEGVPSSDLAVQTLSDLNIPYAAEWEGLGCFNEGVYRFQFTLDSPFCVTVDGRKLRLHESDERGVKFAYACLDGDHIVKVRLDRWTCDKDFTMDVYRLR